LGITLTTSKSRLNEANQIGQVEKEFKWYEIAYTTRMTGGIPEFYFHIPLKGMAFGADAGSHQFT
jgi:hypothetical protein